MQGYQPRVLLLWEAWTFFEGVQNPDNQSSKTEVNHIDTEEQSPDYTQSEYTTPYYLTNDQAKASVKVPQDHSQCTPHTQQGHRTHQTTVSSTVSGILGLSD